MLRTMNIRRIFINEMVKSAGHQQMQCLNTSSLNHCNADSIVKLGLYFYTAHTTSDVFLSFSMRVVLNNFLWSRAKQGNH
jgi:hypothetical protein